MFERRRISKIFSQPSMAQQQFKDDCDVNKIMERHVRFDVPIPNKQAWQVGDATVVKSLEDAIDQISNASAEFDLLPAAVRERFGNDPLNLLKFVADEGNRTEAEKLGLLAKQTVVVPTTPAVDVVPPAVDAGAVSA